MIFGFRLVVFLVPWANIGVALGTLERLEFKRSIWKRQGFGGF